MAARTPVYIVCSPVAGVGKTMVARLLAEFLIADDRFVEAYDLNTNEPSLTDYLPSCAIPSDISSTPGQMALFDRLARNDAAAKVVDLGHGSFERFFTIAAQVGLAEETQRRNVQLIVLYLASPDPSSARAYAALARLMSGLVLVPVHNEALITTLPRDQFPSATGAALPLRIPMLPRSIARVLDDPAFSLSHFRAGRMPPDAKHYQFELESWLKRALLEFRELELRLLLATLGLMRPK